MACSLVGARFTTKQVCPQLRHHPAGSGRKGGDRSAVCFSQSCGFTPWALPPLKAELRGNRRLNLERQFSSSGSPSTPAVHVGTLMTEGSPRQPDPAKPLLPPCVHSSASQLGQLSSLWGCSGLSQMLPASGGWRPGMLFNTLQCTEQRPHPEGTPFAVGAGLPLWGRLLVCHSPAWQLDGWSRFYSEARSWGLEPQGQPGRKSLIL